MGILKRLTAKALLLLLVLTALTTAPASAALRKVDYKNNQVTYNASSPARLAKKLGLKKKKSKAYSKFYKGKYVVIGWNKSSVSYPKKYVYVRNGGSKRFSVYGVKIGDSKATVRKKMNRVSTLYSSTKRSLVYGIFYAGYTFNFNKKGKLTSWVYQLYPTS